MLPHGGNGNLGAHLRQVLPIFNQFEKVTELFLRDALWVERENAHPPLRKRSL